MDEARIYRDSIGSASFGVGTPGGGFRKEISLKSLYEGCLILIRHKFDFEITGINFGEPSFNESYQGLLRKIFDETKEDFGDIFVRYANTPEGIAGMGEGIYEGFASDFEKRKRDILVENSKQGSLYETLRKEGFDERVAETIGSHFEDLVRVSPAGVKSKNLVYFVEDVLGQKRVIKLHANKEGADIEALVGYTYSRHPTLKNFVPSMVDPAATQVSAQGQNYYLTNQQDISLLADSRLEHMRKKGSKDQLFAYVSSWMVHLALLHHHGTQIARNAGITRAAGSLLHERGKERIERAGLILDRALDEDLRNLELEVGSEMIHRDIGPNHIGQFAIDWDHAGFGNYLVDVVSFLTEADVNRHGFLGENEISHFLREYHTVRKKLAQIDDSIDPTFIRKEFRKFKQLSALYAPFQLGFLRSGEDKLSTEQVMNLALLESRFPEVKKEAAGFRLSWLS